MGSELLSHLLVADISRFASAQHAKGDVALSDRILKVVAEAFVGDLDAYVQNAVAVSFVENFVPTDGDDDAWFNSWPTELRREADRQELWLDGDSSESSLVGRVIVRPGDGAPGVLSQTKSAAEEPAKPAGNPGGGESGAFDSERRTASRQVASELTRLSGDRLVFSGVFVRPDVRGSPRRT